ncbi:hypothetical protein M011DRAFT_392320, partial [Sporormia fimetaria CBS 119925]
MDLVQTIRKEGSRGGQGDFTWDSVKDSSHRENYLGHSLKAPVGRWQKGRDLEWWSKGDGPDAEAQERKIAEEKARLKHAEEEARCAALGLPPP